MIKLSFFGLGLGIYLSRDHIGGEGEHGILDRQAFYLLLVFFLC